MVNKMTSFEDFIKKSVDKVMNEPICNGMSVIDLAMRGIEYCCWHSVNDELPPIDEDVLVYAVDNVNGQGQILITSMTDHFYFGGVEIRYNKPEWVNPYQYFEANNRITHWMKLPEPPKDVNFNEHG